MDTAEERTQTGKPAETVGKNSRETCRQSQETPERRDRCVPGSGMWTVRAPTLVGRQPATQDGLTPGHTAANASPCCPSPSSCGVERLAKLAPVLRTRPHGAPSERRTQGGEQSQAIGRTGSPACGWFSSVGTVHIGVGWVFVVGTVLCVAGSSAKPFPGVTTSCLLVDGEKG